jgi:transposase
MMQNERDIETHVGLDMGIIDFVTMSHGTKITNPRFVNRQLKNLRRKQDDRGHYLSKIDRFYPSSVKN